MIILKCEVKTQAFDAITDLPAACLAKFVGVMIR